MWWLMQKQGLNLIIATLFLLLVRLLINAYEKCNNELSLNLGQDMSSV